MNALPPSLRSYILRNPFLRLISAYRTPLLLSGIFYLLLCLLFALAYRLVLILNRPPPPRPTKTATRRKSHLLIVLGSGGHTAEMLSILTNLGADYLNSRFDRRTWVVSSGDGFSAERAREFEGWLGGQDNSSAAQQQQTNYEIVTVRRARKIHQPLYTTPVSAAGCLWDCIQVLRGTHPDLKARSTGHACPDLILLNGPATAVILVLASITLQFLGLAPISPSVEVGGAMRSIYIESWARVKTLSLSGRILRFMVGRFLVQWEGLGDVDLTRGVSEGKGEGEGAVVNVGLPRRREYVGAVVA